VISRNEGGNNAVRGGWWILAKGKKRMTREVGGIRAKIPNHLYKAASELKGGIKSLKVGRTYTPPPKEE